VIVEIWYPLTYPQNCLLARHRPWQPILNAGFENENIERPIGKREEPKDTNRAV
jgi:hypothetical protein